MRDRKPSGASVPDRAAPAIAAEPVSRLRQSEHPLRKRLHGDGLCVCRCGQKKHPRATQCRDCYQPLWREDQDAQLRELVAAGLEYARIGRKLKRTAEACRNRASMLGLKQDRAATLENRKRGRERFYANPAKVARRMKRIMRTFTPDERAVRAEELRQRNIAGTAGIKGRHHTPEVCERIRLAHLGRVVSPETRAKISAARKAYWAAKRDGGQAAYRAALAADRARLQSFNPEIDEARIWCTQCERQVSAARANACEASFCKAKALAA